MPRRLNARRLDLTWADAEIAPHEGGVLVIDETGDRKDGTKTAHVAHQYLGSVGKIANGIVSVTSLWADERAHYPLHVVPYTPAARLPQGKKDPALRTKPQLAVDLVERALDLGVPFARSSPTVSMGRARRSRESSGGAPALRPRAAPVSRNVGAGGRRAHARGRRPGGAVDEHGGAGRLDGGGAACPRRAHRDVVGR
jgi:hypothetical protein